MKVLLLFSYLKSDMGSDSQADGMKRMEQIKIWVRKKIWNKAAVAIAFVHFFVSFWTDRLIFRYVTWDFSGWKQAFKSLETIGVKLAFLVLLIFLWQGIFSFFLRAERRFRRFALFYLTVVLALLLLTWPGIWRMDEFGLLTSSVQLFPHFWQNWITSVWYIYALMLLPFPAGVIVTQLVIVSLVYARVVCGALDEYDLSVKERGIRADTEKERKKRAGFAVLLSIPFFLLPVLDSNLYPMRMSMYAFLELLLLSELYRAAQAFQHARRAGQTSGGMTACGGIQTAGGMTACGADQAAGTARVTPALVCLAAVVTVWRTEAIYYLALFPVIMLAIEGWRRCYKRILLYFMAFLILFVPQKIGEKLTSGQQYQLTSIVLPLVPLVQAVQQDGERELLEQINLVVDTDVIERAAAQGKNGISMFWSEPDFQRTSYTAEDFAGFQSAYHKLIIKYPLVFLMERWQTFLSSTDLLEDTTQLFSDAGVENYRVFAQYPLSRPISNKIRTCVIKKLECRKNEDYKEKHPIADWVYSPVPAVVILAVILIAELLRKRWMAALLVLTACVRVPLVFLTAPSRLFMYYYSVWLIGYVLLFYIAAGYIFRHSRGR